MKCVRKLEKYGNSQKQPSIKPFVTGKTSSKSY